MCFFVITYFRITLIIIFLSSDFTVSNSIGFISNQTHNGYAYRTFPDNFNFLMTNTLNKSDRVTNKKNLGHSCLNFLSFDDIRCGEIVLGVPSSENNDGSISVDIGISQRLIVPRQSMIYMNESEQKQFRELLGRYNSSNTKSTLHLDLNELMLKTIEVSKKIPERKRKTYLKPKFSYPNDFLRTKTEDQESLSYDLGVGGEISPGKISKKKFIDRPFIPDSEKMEFVVTNINPYSKSIQGEFFSEAIVESKRRMYLSMYTESSSLFSHFMQFKAVICDKYETILKVKLLDSKFTHLSGFNAYTLSRQNDNIGDTIDVYIAGADAVIEHVYLFRSHGDFLLRSENLTNIFNGLIKHYIDSGTWFKTQVEKIEDDFLVLRVLGYDDKMCVGYVARDQLPYSFSERVLNETYRRVNLTNDYFNKEDMGIGIGKLNYLYHYDNSIYARVSEFTVEGPQYFQQISSKKGQTDFFLTCKNVCKPNKFIETVYNKMITQKIPDLTSRTDVSYPCLVLGSVGEYIYLAINYTFKENFTLDDEYLVGIMEAGQYSGDLPSDRIIHAKISKIETYSLNGRYFTHKSSNGPLIFKEDPLSIWLMHQGKCGKQSDFPGNIELIPFIFMDVMLLTDTSFPQFNEFLSFQPMLSKFLLKRHFGSGNKSGYEPTSKFTESSVAPSEFTSSLLKRFDKVKNENFRSDYLGSRVITGKANAPIAFAVSYSHNEELRNEHIRRKLDGRRFRMYKNVLESSHFNSETLVRELLTDRNGQQFWEFLDKLKVPILRRNIEMKEAFFFEKSIKQLLSVFKDFFLDDIYGYYDKEDLMFSTIVPKSHKSGFYQMKELEEYFNFIAIDVIMDGIVKRSIHRTLTLLTKPKNSLMSLLRNKHRHIPNDVFFYYRKTVHYSSFEKITRPFKGRHSEALIPPSDEDIEIVSMLPFSTIVKDPGSFGHQLEGYGLHSIRKIYNNLIRTCKPVNSKFADSTGFSGELLNLSSSIEDSDLEDIELDCTDHVKRDIVNGAKRKLRVTYKDWKLLNKYPITDSKEDLKDFVQSLKNFNPVHGIKLPTL